jgi:hypothetical protein
MGVELAAPWLDRINDETFDRLLRRERLAFCTTCRR